MLVFQYGSNISSSRINHADRLKGDAQVVSIAATIDPFQLDFTVWCTINNCAAADIMPDTQFGRSIYGVLYDIPEFLVDRELAKTKQRKSLDDIEGEGSVYKRIQLEVVLPSGAKQTVNTYVVLTRRSGLVTARAYAQHIVDGLHEHAFPEAYRQYVISRIENNNPALCDVFRV